MSPTGACPGKGDRRLPSVDTDESGYGETPFKAELLIDFAPAQNRKTHGVGAAITEKWNCHNGSFQGKIPGICR
jgi:hypothetical protein